MTPRPHTSRTQRRGLAPLELVLSLPLLLFVMALMVAVGAAASWKVRAQVVARQRVWAERWPRAGELVPRPANWPQPAVQAVRGSQPLAMIDLPEIHQPVVRGPLGGGIVVNDALLDPNPQVIEGHSHLERRPPLLPKLGNYTFDVTDALFDGRWQFRQMGLANNQQRRLPFIYRLPPGNGEADYRAAQRAILTSPQRADWLVLDRDEELAAYYRNYIDLHPRLSSFCSLDVQQIQQNNIQRLVERIQGKRPPPRRVSSLPERLASTFRSRYASELAELRAPDAVGNPAREAELEALINLMTAEIARMRAQVPR